MPRHRVPDIRARLLDHTVLLNQGHHSRNTVAVNGVTKPCLLSKHVQKFGSAECYVSSHDSCLATRTCAADDAFREAVLRAANGTEKKPSWRLFSPLPFSIESFVEYMGLGPSRGTSSRNLSTISVHEAHHIFSRLYSDRRGACHVPSR